MSRTRIFVLTVITMIAFAGNTLFCRMALRLTAIDAASFTSIRLVSGAITLWLIVFMFRGHKVGKGSWRSAAALFAYAILYSYAYITLEAAMGALLLFGAVQATMVGYGISKGERLHGWQVAGLLLALGGLVGLLLPGLTAPPLIGSALMLTSGVAWGIYSLRGRGEGDATRISAGNFLRAAPMALVVSLFTLSDANPDAMGIAYAVASGALSSGIGYAIWYSVLPELKAASASTVQLSVPVITALGGVLFLGEAVTLRLMLASMAILGGIALVILKGHRAGK
jgi:drug/metabolite transporter (DMT)-like permease